jgi:hypothetical protein
VLTATIIGDLRPLPEEVLRVIVLEAEARLAAQLQVASAADQRSLALAGFTITSTTAASTGFLYLLESQSQKAGLFISVIILIFGLLLATVLALYSAWSRTFTLPGSRPGLWVPGNWTNGQHGNRTVKQALLEQCHCLEQAINDNAKIAKKIGVAFNISMTLALVSVAVAVVIVVNFPS